jgi:hypothetical protein
MARQGYARHWKHKGHFTTGLGGDINAKMRQVMLDFANAPEHLAYEDECGILTAKEHGFGVCERLTDHPSWAELYGFDFTTSWKQDWDYLSRICGITKSGCSLPVEVTGLYFVLNEEGPRDFELFGASIGAAGSSFTLHRMLGDPNIFQNSARCALFENLYEILLRSSNIKNPEIGISDQRFSFLCYDLLHTYYLITLGAEFCRSFQTQLNSPARERLHLITGPLEGEAVYIGELNSNAWHGSAEYVRGLNWD